jgi:hypothetical protein
MSEDKERMERELKIVADPAMRIMKASKKSVIVEGFLDILEAEISINGKVTALCAAIAAVLDNHLSIRLARIAEGLMEKQPIFPSTHGFNHTLPSAQEALNLTDEDIDKVSTAIKGIVTAETPLSGLKSLLISKVDNITKACVMEDLFSCMTGQFGHEDCHSKENAKQVMEEIGAGKTIH